MTKNICIQGLGFVGSAMAVAVADACDGKGNPLFNVTGIDLDSPLGRGRIDAVARGEFPFPTTDSELIAKTKAAHERGNLAATADTAAYAKADVIIVSVPFDVSGLNGDAPALSVEPFAAAIETFAALMRPDCLVIVETTVPPGTCRNIVYPILARHLGKDVLLAHSYERVMPGAQYLSSIVNFYRCYAGIDDRAAQACGAFLTQVINSAEWPLTRLSSLEASEIGKLMENSYRAVNIALIEEWAALAESINVNLYEVIDAIRLRPTHANIRQPGFGVGGYCLPKDPLLARLGCEKILGISAHDFPFCELAVGTNHYMPLRCLKRLEERLGGLKGKNILLLGASYRQEIGDSRYSPSLDFIHAAEGAGARVTCHDPLVEDWEGGALLKGDVHAVAPGAFDAIVIAVPHQAYRALDWLPWLKESSALIFDACGFLNDEHLNALKQKGHDVYVIGRGAIAA